MTRRWLGVWIVCGCVRAQQPSPAVVTAACAGEAPRPEGMRAVSDPARRDRVVHPAGEGGLCAAEVFEVTAPVTLHRMWSRGRPSSRTGRWWTLTPMRGSAAQYRVDYEVCPEWNDLDASVRCTLPAGARVVIGTGQSVRCAGGLDYGVSPAAQVFVEDPSVLVDCADGPQ